MNARNIFFTILLAGAGIYFFIKYLPMLSDLADKGSSLLIVLILLLGLGYMIYRVLRE
ncbi:MAG: hypothetical protein KDC66_02585 [Phaeodactylibacter sp.]|nr:hypothetical protein [Phaeodactylibacter sp.]MCB9275028.1 hypothetical protein [Lewinellaceae bacterium]